MDGLKTSDYFYELPPELIAQDPLEDRSSSRLMVLDQKTGAVSHHVFPGDPLFSQARRLPGPEQHQGDSGPDSWACGEETGGAVEVLLLKRRTGDECGNAW